MAQLIVEPMLGVGSTPDRIFIFKGIPPDVMRRQGVENMEVTNSNCAGLDVHKKTVVTCCLTTKTTGEIEREIRTFSTMSRDLLALGDWLHSKDITHVAMESTGEYWKAVYNLLESGFEVLVVN